MDRSKFYIEAQTKDGLARIDIAATEVTIPIDIVANEVTLPVSIAAAAVTIPVNISATEVILDMSFNAQSVGVYLQQHWAVQQGDDKSLRAFEENAANGGGVTAFYTVPTGKTFYVTGIQAFCYAKNIADADKAQHFYTNVTDHTGSFRSQFGGDGGGVIDMSQPLRVDSGDGLTYSVVNASNHLCSVGIIILGYEV